MLSKEQFEKIESEHGCGYWKLCWEHACPCAITTENKGLREDIYNGFIKENDEIEDIEIPHYEKCPECGGWEKEEDFIHGMCSVCYEECKVDEEYE